MATATTSQTVFNDVPPSLINNDLSATLSRAVIQAFSSYNNHALLNRLAIQKRDLTFDGDIFNFLHFKNSFDHTRKPGFYSDPDNAIRLHKCHKGKALQAVQSLMMASTSSCEIKDALKKQFGNTEEVILRQVAAIETCLD